jgi:transposase
MPIRNAIWTFPLTPRINFVAMLALFREAPTSMRYFSRRSFIIAEIAGGTLRESRIGDKGVAWMEPYPLSVRKRIIQKYQSGLDTTDIAEDYGYCVAGVRRVWQRFRETGSFKPRQGKVGRRPSFDAKALERLRSEVERRPDATLAELRESVGVAIDLSNYCRALKKLGLTRKKSRFTPASGRVGT